MVALAEPRPLAYGNILNGILTAQGELTSYNLDIAYGFSENNFELQTNTILSKGTFIWIDGTSSGGVIDSIGITAETTLRTYKGRTWFALLQDKIVEPPAGQDYLVLSGTPASIISRLVTDCNLAGNQPGGVFTMRNAPIETTRVSAYQVDRYITLWDTLVKICTQYQLKIAARTDNGRIMLSLEPPNTMEVDERQASINIDSGSASPTHLIGLGAGELAAREICHRYINPSGQIVTTPPSSGWQDISQTYDINDKKGDDLIKATEQKLRELQVTGSGEITFTGNAEQLEPWDTLIAHDWEHALSLSAQVKKKIYKVSGLRAQTTIELGNK